jgi:hypothetical protein
LKIGGTIRQDHHRADALISVVIQEPARERREWQSANRTDDAVNLEL